MRETQVTTKIANTTVRLPVYRDKATTLKIAEEIGARIKRLEKSSERFDTHAFALQAAFELATELCELRGAHAEDEREIVVALEQLASRLAAVAEKA